MTQVQGLDVNQSEIKCAKLRVKSFDKQMGIVTIDSTKDTRVFTLDELYLLEAKGEILLTNAVMFHTSDGVKLVKSKGTANGLCDGHLYAWDSEGTSIDDIDLLDNAYKAIVFNDEHIQAIFCRIPNVEELILPDSCEINFKFGEALGSMRYISSYSCKAVSLHSFANCSSLTEVFLPNLVTLFACVFLGSGIRHIDLPNCKEVGTEVFKNCRELVDVNLPACCYLGDSVFLYCSKLQSVKMPSCTEIGRYAFGSCENLTDVELPRLTVLGAHAFSWCKSLKAISFPCLEKVVSNYEGAAFQGCTKLQTVDLGKVPCIYPKMFEGCKSLVSVRCSECTNVSENAFNDCAKLENFDFSQTLAIMEDAFSGTRVRYVVAPRCLRIDVRAFANCNNLSYVSAPRCEYVGADAFVNSSVEIAILSRLNLLYSYTFGGCKQLHYCVISAEELAVYPQAFANCPSLKYTGFVGSDGKLPQIDWGTVYTRDGRMSELLETPMLLHYIKDWIK